MDIGKARALKADPRFDEPSRAQFSRLGIQTVPICAKPATPDAVPRDGTAFSTSHFSMREFGSGDPGPQRHFHLASYFHPVGRWAYCQRPFAFAGCTNSPCLPHCDRFAPYRKSSYV
jgi:hypothetical protein